MADTDIVTLTSDPADDLAPADGWQIENLGGVEWALERLSKTAGQLAENAALLAQAQDRLRLRVAAINRPLERAVAFFEAALRAYASAHRDELLKGGKKKSREFPGGTIGWRKSGGRLRVLDEAAALAWSREQPLDADLYRVKVELNKAAVQAHFKATGEVPPGCDVEPEEEVCFVKPAELALDIGTPILPALPEKL